MKAALTAQNQEAKKPYLLLKLFLCIVPLISLIFILPSTSLGVIISTLLLAISLEVGGFCFLNRNKQISLPILQPPSPSFLSSPNFSDPDLRVAVDEVNALFPPDYYPNIPQLSYEAWETEYESLVMRDAERTGSLLTRKQYNEKLKSVCQDSVEILAEGSSIPKESVSIQVSREALDSPSTTFYVEYRKKGTNYWANSNSTTIPFSSKIAPAYGSNNLLIFSSSAARTSDYEKYEWRVKQVTHGSVTEPSYTPSFIPSMRTDKVSSTFAKGRDRFRAALARRREYNNEVTSTLFSCPIPPNVVPVPNIGTFSLAIPSEPWSVQDPIKLILLEKGYTIIGWEFATTSLYSRKGMLRIQSLSTHKISVMSFSLDGEQYKNIRDYKDLSIPVLHAIFQTIKNLPDPPEIAPEIQEAEDDDDQYVVTATSLQGTTAVSHPFSSKQEAKNWIEQEKENLINVRIEIRKQPRGTSIL